LGKMDAYLSTTQLGITLSSLALGWIGQPAFSRLLITPLALLGISDPTWVHRLTIPIVFAFISGLHIIIGELAPKTLAILRAEQVAMAIALPMRFVHWLLFPFTWVLNRLSDGFLAICGFNRDNSTPIAHSEEEIRLILAQARSAGMLSVARSELLHRTLSLANKNARFLMMPRNEVDFFDINLNLEDNLKRIKNSNHSRFPLCDRDLDALIGIVDVRVLLEQMQRKKEIDLKEICTTPRYYPEVIPAEVLLQEFRKHHHAMAIIVDEYGGTSGIVTSADIVTAVMGELDDDDDGDDMVHVGEGSYDVDGITPLEEVEEELHISLKTEGMRTITGWLMEKLGRMPKMGDRIKFSGYVFSVTDVLGPKVRRVRIERE